MAAMLPMAVYGLEVPPGDFPISGRDQIESAFRITMAAIDPSAEAEGEEGAAPRATLKILRTSLWEEDDDDSIDSDEFDADEFEREILNGDDDDSEEDSEEDDEAGPSDPAKSKKARKAAALEAIKKLLDAPMSDADVEEDDDETPNGVNGKSAKALGKMPVDDDEDSELDDDEEIDFDEFVLCTLDPTKNFQQPLDITIGENERVFFKVSGTHTIYLTGNYVVPAGDDSDEYDSDELDEDYDLEPDSDEIDDYDEEDELDALEDPRIMEVMDEDEDVPALVKAAEKKADKKGKNKRPAEDEVDGLDEIIAEANVKEGVNGDAKLSKKQLKKLKKADGSAAVTATEAKTQAKVDADAPSSANKKVQFAKNLEQGPTPTKDAAKSADKSKAGQATLGVKTVQGVKIDDKKLGTGPAAKNGDRVGMRYIGKLEKDNKVFDANKKGKPFTFKLGAGEVIKGWDIGIQGMSAGGERRITIPANLAYGSKGAPPDIPGNANLIFDVKLLELKGK